LPFVGNRHFIESSNFILLPHNATFNISFSDSPKIYMMEEELSISDLKQIIQTLIEFIAVDGKEFVNDTKKHEYVSSYVLLLIKMIHQLDTKEQVSLVENISHDIAKYIK